MENWQNLSPGARLRSGKDFSPRMNVSERPTGVHRMVDRCAQNDGQVCTEWLTGVYRMIDQCVQNDYQCAQKLVAASSSSRTLIDGDCSLWRPAGTS